MAMTYIPQLRTDRTQPQFMMIDNVIMERHLVDTLVFIPWDIKAVPTMTEYCLSKWSEGDKGVWISEHGHNLFHCSHNDISTDDIKLAIYAYLPPKRWTEYCLRFLDNSSNERIINI